MQHHGVKTEVLRAVDYDLAPGVYPDMTKKGASKDDWPKLSKKIFAADILVIASPIWLGERSSVCARVMERIYAHSGETNDKDQYAFTAKSAAAW